METEIVFIVLMLSLFGYWLYKEIQFEREKDEYLRRMRDDKSKIRK